MWATPMSTSPTLLMGDPDLGPEAGGTTVVLTGTDLTGATAVDFGVTPAASFTVDSNTQITAISPAGTGLAEVTVTTPGGTSNNVFFTYLPVPTLTSVNPNSGPETGGDSVTLTGTDFALHHPGEFRYRTGCVHRYLRHTDRGHQPRWNRDSASDRHHARRNQQRRLLHLCSSSRSLTINGSGRR